MGLYRYTFSFGFLLLNTIIPRNYRVINKFICEEGDNLYAIKLTDDKELETTIHSTIYQGDKNSDTLVFLIPRKYEDVNMSDCFLSLRYILPDGTGRSEELEMFPIPHNEEYFQYRLTLASRFTDIAGEIEIWITAMNFEDDVLFRSGTTKISVIPHKNIERYLPPEDLYQIDKLAAKVNKLEITKADDLSWSEESKQLQLTSRGKLIGNAVDLNSATSDGVIHFGDNTTEDGSNDGDDDSGIIHF